MRRENGNRRVFDTFKRVNAVSKFFFVSPYTFGKDNALIIHEKLSWFEFLFSVATISAELSLQLYFIQPSFQGNPYLLLAYIRSTTGMIFSLLTCIEMKLKHESMKIIFEEIRTINNEISLTEKNEKEFSTKTNQFLFFLFTLVILGNANIIYLTERNLYVRILIAFQVTRLTSQQLLMEIQFATLISLIGYYIDWVQKNLQRKIIPTRQSSQLFVVSKGAAIPGNRLSVRTVQELRQCYGRINDTKVKINEAFGFRLWLVIMTTFVELVFFIFLNVLILQFWNSNRPGFYSPRLIWINVWVIFIVFFFIHIVNLCEKVAEMGKRMGILVHELHAVSSDENVRKELSAFSLELLHRNPSFTAYKFFNIDYPLVSSVLSSSLMHIIILLQFQFPDYDDGVRPIQDLISRS